MIENEKIVPEEIKGWNWGAFLYSVFWGFGNRTYLPLLSLIPVFGFIWMFVVGFKGQEWAWKKSNYSSENITDIKAFQAIQSSWNRAGLIMFMLWLIGIILFLAIIVIAALIGLFQN